MEQHGGVKTELELGVTVRVTGGWAHKLLRLCLGYYE